MNKLRLLKLLIPAFLMLGCATHISKYKDIIKYDVPEEDAFPPLNIYLTPSFTYKATRSCSTEKFNCPSDVVIFESSIILNAFKNNTSKLNINFTDLEYAQNKEKCSDYPGCDLEFKFQMTHSENGFLELMSKLVTLASLSIIPTPFFVKYDFDLKIFDKKNMLVGEYHRQERLTEWVQIGLIFFAKRHNRYFDSNKILTDVIENIMAQIKHDGIIKKPVI